MRGPSITSAQNTPNRRHKPKSVEYKEKGKETKCHATATQRKREREKAQSEHHRERPHLILTSSILYNLTSHILPTGEPALPALRGLLCSGLRILRQSIQLTRLLHSSRDSRSGLCLLRSLCIQRLQHPRLVILRCTLHLRGSILRAQPFEQIPLELIPGPLRLLLLFLLFVDLADLLVLEQFQLCRCGGSAGKRRLRILQRLQFLLDPQRPLTTII